MVEPPCDPRAPGKMRAAKVVSGRLSRGALVASIDVKFDPAGQRDYVATGFPSFFTMQVSFRIFCVISIPVRTRVLRQHYSKR